MTPTSVEASRLDQFTENELALMGAALTKYASDLLADAEREEIAHEDLQGAGAVFYQTLVLAYEVADYTGDEHPELETTLAMAQTIAEGDAPLAAKMAAEAAGVVE